jgi:type II secretory pathway component PulK
VLLVTLVLLVVLATLGYTLSGRISAQRRRCQYVVDYQAARYGCDSAVKYALATLEEISPQLVERPNEPDFSDLFHLSEEEYRELLAEAAIIAAERAAGVNDVNYFADINDINEFDLISDIDYDINDVNDINDFGDIDDVTDFNDPNTAVIRGPYGPPWPLVSQPAQFEIGSAKVEIQIEDENAKYPLGWMLLNNKQVRPELKAGFQTFCEWMDVNEVEMDFIAEELEEIAKIKAFKVEFKKITKRTPVRDSRSKSRSSRSSRSRRSRRSRYKTTTVSVAEQVNTQACEFARLFHSSLIDTEALARPTLISETRKESLLKYMAVWGSRKVNINTAPRHVLEAAFAFGGDADKIAHEIIERRRVKPFADIDELKEALLRYSDAVRKCEDYVTTVSSFFTIRVTVVSGVAEASAVIAVTKDEGKARRIAIISG